MRDSSVTARAATLRADSIIDPAIASGQNWEQQKDKGLDWKKILLVAGLGILSWISTYTGMLELIQANMGDVSLVYKTAIGFSVAMLMLMIIWLLDQLFGRLNFVVRLLFIIGYLLLTVISVGFGFGFYWKFLESRGESSRSAVSAVGQVQASLNMAQTRLEQLQTTLDALTTSSTQKAVDEREKGNSCVNSRPGDGPRRRLRDDDASRFEVAGNFVSARVGHVKTDIAALESDLLKIVNTDRSTIDAASGTRNEFMQTLSRKLDMTVTRFNAFRTDPQLRQFRVDFADRSERTVFPDGKGGTFACPDGQLQALLRGVVLAIDQLPTLEKPRIAVVEGSEAIIEAFRRLTTTMFGALQLKMPPTPDELRTQQQRAVQSVENIAAWRQAQDMQAGLGQRDYIPLLIAVFVDFCLLLVSVSRPMNRFQALIPKMRDAQEGPVIHILSRFHQIHQNPEIKQNFEIFRHVVFDYARDYYVAVPMRAPEHAEDRDDLQTEAHLLANLFTSFEADKVFKRVSWPNSRIARNRLDQQGSKFSECESFRIYRFNEGAWSEMILGAIMGAAKRAEADERTKQTAARRLREELEPQVLENITHDIREELEPLLREEVRTELEASMKRRDAEAKRRARKKRSFFDFVRPGIEEGGSELNGSAFGESIAHRQPANDAATTGAAELGTVTGGLSSAEHEHAADLARTLKDLVSELKEVRATTGRANQAQQDAEAEYAAASARSAGQHHAGQHHAGQHHAGGATGVAAGSADVLTGRFGNSYTLASGGATPGTARFGELEQPASFIAGHPAAPSRNGRQWHAPAPHPASDAPQVIDLAAAKSEAEASKAARFSSTDLDALSATLRRATQNSPHSGSTEASGRAGAHGYSASTGTGHRPHNGATSAPANGEIRLNDKAGAKTSAQSRPASNAPTSHSASDQSVTLAGHQPDAAMSPRSTPAEVAAFVEATRQAAARPAPVSKLPPVESLPTILTTDSRREPTLPGPSRPAPVQPSSRPQPPRAVASRSVAPSPVATRPVLTPAQPQVPATRPSDAALAMQDAVPAGEQPSVEVVQLGHLPDIDIESITARFGRKNRNADPDRKA